MLDEIRQVATMIDMGVRKDHRIHAARAIGEVKISDVRFAASTLIQPTIQQEAVPIDLQQVLAPRDCVRRAMKIDPHLASQKPHNLLTIFDEARG
jgi:hypothetical protein